VLESAHARWSQRWSRKIPARASLARIGKFFFVGGSGMLANTGVLVILYQHMHVALVVA
jgi:putative flippase GtrA